MSSSVLIVSIRLDGESEEVEARVVGDEDRVETVPAVVGVGHRILKVNPGVSNPGEPTGSDGTEPNDI